MKTIRAYKNLKLEFYEEGEENPYEKPGHKLFVNGVKVPWSVTQITGVIFKDLSWWASGEALKGLGWYNWRTLDKLYSGDELAQKRKEAEINLSLSFSEVKAQTIDGYRELLNECYAAHSKIKREAGDIGDQVHEYAELWSLGLKPEMPEDERAANGCLAFMKWLDEEKIKITHPEEIVYSKKYGFWGKSDADGVRKGKNYCLDYKTGKEIYKDFHLQNSAYLFGKQEMYGRKYDGGFLIHFDKLTGNFEPKYIPQKEARKDFDAFLHAFSLKKRLQEIK